MSIFWKRPTPPSLFHLSSISFSNSILNICDQSYSFSSEFGRKKKWIKDELEINNTDKYDPLVKCQDTSI